MWYMLRKPNRTAAPRYVFQMAPIFCAVGKTSEVP